MRERWQRHGRASAHMREATVPAVMIFELLQIRVELVCLHVIGKPSEREVLPSRIRGILSRLSQTSKPFHMHVPNPVTLEVGGKTFSIKLRVVT